MKQAEQIAKDLLTRQAGKKKKRVVSRVLDYSWATEKRAMSKEEIIDYMEKHGGGYYTNHRFGGYKEIRKKKACAGAASENSNINAAGVEESKPTARTNEQDA